MNTFNLSIIKNRACEESQNFIQNEDKANLDDSFCILKINEDKTVVMEKIPSNHLFFRLSIMVLQYFSNLMAHVANINFTGRLVVGLHDSYKEKDKYKGIFVFSRSKSSKGQILLPDLYAMSNYDNKLDIKDTSQFIEKINKAIFIGSDTGDLNPQLNRRLQLCNWATNHKDDCTCLILYNGSQIERESDYKIKTFYPNFDSFSTDQNMSIEEQRRYKFCICMDGNTCAWDRFVWQLASNSVTLKEKSENMCWYYPLMEPGKEYLEFENFDDIIKIMHNEKINFAEVIENGKQFVANYLTYKCHLLYTAFLLNEMHSIKSK